MRSGVGSSNGAGASEYASGEAGRIDESYRGRAGCPSGGGRDVGGRSVAVGGGGSELLHRVYGDRWAGRRNQDGSDGRDCERSGRAESAERGSNRARPDGDAGRQACGIDRSHGGRGGCPGRQGSNVRGGTVVIVAG